MYRCFNCLDSGTGIALVLLGLFWGSGLAWLWHLGLVQPFLRHLAVELYLACGALALAAILLYRLWLGIRGPLDQALGAIDYLKEQVEYLFSRLGLVEDTVEYGAEAVADGVSSAARGTLGALAIAEEGMEYAISGAWT